MRTTVTLDDDVAEIVRRRMAERGVSFREALNDAIRAGLAASEPAFRTPTSALGTPGINLDRALALAGELEDEELVRKLRVGK